MNTAEVESRVKALVREQVGMVLDAPVKNEENLIEDLGFDSLDTVELTMALEDEYGFDIPDEDFQKIETVQHAIDYVLTHPVKVS